MPTKSKSLQFAQTNHLNIGYYRSGPSQGKKIILLHGWPDDVETWNRILPSLHDAGFETITPYLRGFGPTQFLQKEDDRTGQLSALGQDLIEFADALNLKKFAVIGHDWGARAAYIASCLIPGRITHCISLSIGWGTNHPDQTLSFEQTQRFWYQWYMGTQLGEKMLHKNKAEFTRYIWDDWTPNWQISEAEYQATAASFENPDWLHVTLHSYRVRWGLAEKDLTYQDIEEKLQENQIIKVPTLLIHGTSDPCTLLETSANKEHLFANYYKRVTVEGVGHFPQREAPEKTSLEIITFLEDTPSF